MPYHYTIIVYPEKAGVAVTPHFEKVDVASPLVFIMWW